MSITAKRSEKGFIDEHNEHKSATFISIYDDKTGAILSESGPSNAEGFISLIYDGLEYISYGRDREVCITLASLKEKFKK